MELNSPPEMIEETVTDVDTLFVGGIRDSLTLREADTISRRPNMIVINIVNPPEEIVYYLRHIVSTRTQVRVMRKPVKKEKA